MALRNGVLNIAGGVARMTKSELAHELAREVEGLTKQFAVSRATLYNYFPCGRSAAIKAE
jgi:hypothetical protein